MVSDYKKPLPAPDEITKPFWDAAAQHEFRLQYCEGCSRYIHPPQPSCPHCFRVELDWRPVSGRGTVATFAVVHHSGHIPGFGEKDVPYAVGLIDLEEQEALRFLSNIVDCDSSDVHIGMPVQAKFEDVTPEVTLVKFHPVA